MNWKIIMTLFITVCICYSCGEDENMEPEVEDDNMESEVIDLNNCITSLEPANPFNYVECDTTLSSEDSLRLCQKISLGTTSFSEISKEFLPQFCLDTGEVIEYINPNGQIALLELIQKGFNLSYSTYGIPGAQCENNNDGDVAYCVISEFAILSLKMDSTFSLTIILKTELDTNNFNVSGELKFGDILSILTFGGIYDMRIVTDQKDSNFNFENQEFYDQITLNNETYFEVYSTDTSNSQEPRNKFYYNKEFGVVGFINKEGILWNLNN